jgi:Hint domain
MKLQAMQAGADRDQAETLSVGQRCVDRGWIRKSDPGRCDSTNPNTVFQFRGTSGDLLVNPNFKGVIANMNVGTSADTPTTRFDVRTDVTSGTIDGTSLKLFNGTSLVATERLANSYAASTQVSVESGPNNTTAVFFSTATPCYAAGTRILTAEGEKAVEDLREGEMVIVLTDQGQVPRPVTWIGYREIDLARHPHPDRAAPIRIRRHAVGPDQPHRDLLVSPDHCLFVDGKLIPALMLVNDMTIVQERDRTAVRYFHVELERHVFSSMAS